MGSAHPCLAAQTGDLAPPSPALTSLWVEEGSGEEALACQGDSGTLGDVQRDAGSGQNHSQGAMLMPKARCHEGTDLSADKSC